MSTARELIEHAFERLRERPGFVERGDQKQLALLLSDMIGAGTTGSFEAPTGLGKSLAALIPAIAHAIAGGKRTVIATYTNVLAEQYWRHDLPLALSLFEPDEAGDLALPQCQFLIGRQRYACLAAIEDQAPDLMAPVMRTELGIETEFRQAVRRSARQLSDTWRAISAPPVCAGRVCHHYNECFYYQARRQAESAPVVITNHSVVIQDAMLAGASEDGRGLLGAFDFLVLDEAHDFAQAALSGLEFELSAARLSLVAGIGTRLERTMLPLAERAGDQMRWLRLCEELRAGMERAQKALVSYGLQLGQEGILTAAPEEVLQHPQVRSNLSADGLAGAIEVAEVASEESSRFVRELEDLLAEWRSAEGGGEPVRQAAEMARSYVSYIREFAISCERLLLPSGVAVSYAGRSSADTILRQDVIGLAGPLTEMIWSRTPWACMSATLAIDGTFEFFSRTTGASAEYEEILPSPFDYARQAALYLPPADRIPDPSAARKQGKEEDYYRALGAELSQIIRCLEGRTLALFHSRKEMEGVLRHMDLPPELPLLMQFRSGAGAVGERFKTNVNASLFALRSFWTGFDAPGETLSCVAIVRVPFEVPVEPPQIARLAWLHTQNLDPFRSHTLPLAKMLVRQGAGRLLRRADDRGVIAVLDPRLRSKIYGEEILANLPPDLRAFDSIDDAAGWVGVGASLV